jgi:hypothetical protein
MKARSPPAYFEFSANRFLAESGTFKTCHHAFAPKSRATTAFFRIPQTRWFGCQRSFGLGLDHSVGTNGSVTFMNFSFRTCSCAQGQILDSLGMRSPVASRIGLTS